MSEKLVSLPSVEDCWKHIGVWGDRSCPELERVTHCRNCEVFSSAGRSLLERAAPIGYLADWTANLRAGKEPQRGTTVSMIVFRLGSEWLALAARCLKEVTESKPVHRVPHRSGRILLGLVNVRGEMNLCVSLADLIGVETEGGADAANGRNIYPRMVVIERAGERWVFPADEVAGIHRLPVDDLLQAPVTVARAPSSFTRGTLEWESRAVGLLDEDLVFQSLKKGAV